MKKNLVFIFMPLAVLALLLSACRAANRQVPAPSVEMVVSNESPGLVQEVTAGAPGSQPVAFDSAAPTDRLVIMNAELQIVVSDPAAKVQAIADLAARMGGFVVEMNVYQIRTSSGQQVPEGFVRIRVPAADLERALTEIKADAVEVRSETRSGQDVTQQYTDLQSQLRHLQAAEAELMEIMEEATDTQDVLDVFNQLEYYRAQIETVRGQIQYYEQSAAYSLISVTVVAEETVQPIQIGPWTPKGALNEAVQDLVRFLQGFADFLIRFFLYILPVMILIFGPPALVVWGIATLVRRGRRKKAPPASS
ncbi:MAG: DUF4349 domain-containing protein [Anaerolineales bacterium]